MKKNFKNILAFSLMSLALLSGCKDSVLEEIKTLNTDRAFSATGLTATVINKINARLTWTKVSNASSYTIEVYDNVDFSGTPVKTITGIKYDQVPYTVTGLAGATQHAVRVKSIGSNGSADSKWVSVTFKTDAEQILNPVSLGDITATSVKITWPANETVTRLVFNPGNISRTLTPAEIAAGSATVTGLVAETLYTVSIFNNAIQRGSTTFTTAIDVSAFTQVHNDSELTAALAASGSVRIALHPGTYTLTSDITANKNITIVGTDAVNKPVINRAVFKLEANAALTLNNVKLDGNQASNTNQLIIYNAASTGTYGAVSILNSEMYNYAKGLLYINVSALIESITLENNIFHDINVTGAAFVDMRLGFAKTFSMKNNTLYNFTTSDSQRDLFRIDNVTTFPTQTSNKLTVTNNTFYNVMNYTGTRYFYNRLTTLSTYFNKNIVVNSLAYYTNQSATIFAEMLNNNYFNAANFYESTTTSAKNDATANGYTKLDPGFTNAAAGNFTISNVDLKAYGIGDVRWR
ncbi:DUF4957 domain-containing protein [Pedobacter sp. ASV28]|jgi:Domain of unknown function (DUF4957)/Domain of unknown function (DUF5123)|uniref:DUF4957 domain-containing protein n=1 Tax=Pedobacter sp. ASV28 TaxID=2795123 RepID=UPI0018ED5B21|nr:DUF4957 domain-containing protein [Pedobacter sp. ASV28]